MRDHHAEFSVYISRIKTIFFLIFIVFAVLIGIFGKVENFTYTKTFFLPFMAPIRWMVIFVGCIIAIRTARLAVFALQGKPLIMVSNSVVELSYPKAKFSAYDIEEVRFTSDLGFFIKVNEKKYSISTFFCVNPKSAYSKITSLQEFIKHNN